MCVNTAPAGSILQTVCRIFQIHVRRRKQQNGGLDPFPFPKERLEDLGKEGGIILKRVMKRI